MVRIFKCREMVEDEGNGHGGNNRGVMTAIRPRIKGRSLDTVQETCVPSEMPKNVAQLYGQLQHSEKRSGFGRGGAGSIDQIHVGGLPQAELILRKQPVRSGGGGAGPFHCLARENLVPVWAGRGETCKNNGTLGLRDDMVATVVAMSSGTSGRMYQTDGQMDEVTKEKCKVVLGGLENVQLDGRMDRPNGEQCKFIINGSECLEMDTNEKVKRKKRRGVRNRNRNEYRRSEA